VGGVRGALAEVGTRLGDVDVLSNVNRLEAFVDVITALKDPVGTCGRGRTLAPTSAQVMTQEARGERLMRLGM